MTATAVTVPSDVPTLPNLFDAAGHAVSPAVPRSFTPAGLGVPRATLLAPPKAPPAPYSEGAISVDLIEDLDDEEEVAEAKPRSSAPPLPRATFAPLPRPAAKPPLSVPPARSRLWADDRDL